MPYRLATPLWRLRAPAIQTFRVRFDFRFTGVMFRLPKISVINGTKTQYTVFKYYLQVFLLNYKSLNSHKLLIIVVGGQNEPI